MQEAQNHVDPVDSDSDPDPQQWLKNMIFETSLVAWTSFNQGKS
jgi:hypothetical protein